MKINRKKPLFSIPTNSMSDVAFLLLIFIMLVALINYRKEVPVQKPTAQTAGKITADKNMVIWIQKDGTTYLDGNPTTEAAIENAVQDIYLKAPDTRIQIIADKATPFRYVEKVLNLLQLLEYRRVGFVVKETSP
jgi:biopolymer transport protein ExbD